MAINENLQNLVISPVLGYAGINAPKNSVDNYVLLPSTAKTIVVPTFTNTSGAQTKAQYCIINSSADFWVNWGAVATVPISDKTDGTGQELNPAARSLSGVSSFSIISESAAKISIAWFRA
jgi:hypothetical protein